MPALRPPIHPSDGRLQEEIYSPDPAAFLDRMQGLDKRAGQMMRSRMFRAFFEYRAAGKWDWESWVVYPKNDI
jgi:hypothetical protein